MLIKNEYKPQMVTATPAKKPSSGNGRMLLVLFLLAVGFTALIGRGVYLQTSKQDFLLKQGNQRFVRTIPMMAVRGAIYDRSGRPIALSAPTKSIFATPSSMPEPTSAEMSQLASLLGLSVAELSEKLGRKDRGFVYLKRQMSMEAADQIKALGIKGIAFQPESKRFYPTGDLFAHVIGFAGIDGHGQEGLELARDKLLTGTDGARMVLRDNRGNIVDNIDSPNNKQPVNGQDMVLSLDQQIQLLAYDELNKAVDKHKAKSGSAVVLDAQTGEVLALVNAPTFDPSKPGLSNADMRRNRAVTDMIEPGSTMKPFPVAFALDEGKVTPNTLMNTLPYNIGPNRVRDTHDYPSLTVRGVLQKSSNVGSSKMSAMFTPEQMYQFYKSVGFGSKTGSTFPGESPGMVRHWQGWRPFEQATMSFGYGIQVNLLQLAQAYTIFTNDGKLLPATFIKQDKAPAGTQVIKPETAAAIREMMISVTEKGGTGTRGSIDGFDVAAKSGTARKLVDGRYSATKHTGMFIGFAPAQNPRVIVAVLIDEPSDNGYYGGVVAGPPFKEILSNSLRILGVAPTKATTKESL